MNQAWEISCEYLMALYVKTMSSDSWLSGSCRVCGCVHVAGDKSSTEILIIIRLLLCLISVCLKGNYT